MKNNMSMLRKLRRNVCKKLCPLYYTTIGSLVATVMQVTGKSEEEALEYYKFLEKNKKILEEKTFSEIAEYVFTTFGDEKYEEIWKQSLIIVYDDRRSPMFALSDGETVMPLKKDGAYTGILMEFMKDEPQVAYEFIFDVLTSNEEENTYNG